MTTRVKFFAEALMVLFCIFYLWHCIAWPLDIVTETIYDVRESDIFSRTFETHFTPSPLGADILKGSPLTVTTFVDGLFTNIYFIRELCSVYLKCLYF